MKTMAMALAGLSTMGLMGMGAQSAKADGFRLNVSVPVTTARVYSPGYYAQPTYVAPAYSYAAPTYVAPPVYTPSYSYAPAPTYYYPQYVASPVYVQPRTVVVEPAPLFSWFSFGFSSGHDHGHGGHDHHR